MRSEMHIIMKTTRVKGVKRPVTKRKFMSFSSTGKCGYCLVAVDFIISHDCLKWRLIRSTAILK